MNNRPPDELKALATELSNLLYTRSKDIDRINTLKALFLKETINDDKVQPQGSPAAQQPGTHVGIWKRVFKNEKWLYERDARYHAEWHLWAGVQKLYPKSNKKRVVLLGESVARGYFYDPYYSVATELEATLSAIPVTEDTEVIDLARTSLTMSGLEALLVSCTALEPDAVLIFAGNNWHTEFDKFLQSEMYVTRWSEWQTGSLQDIQEWIEDKFRHFVQAFLEKINTALIQKNIPVVFIIPGFNLKDWKSDEVEQAITRLSGQQAKEWIEADRKAGSASEAGNHEQLEASAKTLIAIDPSNPLGFERLAEACLLQGKWEAAKAAFEKARDTTLISRGINSKPRCFGVIKATIKQYAGGYGMHVIDADGILSQYATNNLPDREQYLDYCHLTIDSIKWLMRYTAQTLTHILTGQWIAIQDIPATSLHPGKEAVAIAHFCAAIHNAHYGQGAAILEYHCAKALSSSPTVKELMTQYADFVTRRTSSVFCSAFEEIILSGKMKQYEGGFALAHARGRKLLDIALVDAMVRSLRSTGTDIVQKITDLRIQEHGIGRETTHLLESFYSCTSYNEFAQATKPAYCQVRTPVKNIFFIADGGDPLLFTLVYRTTGQSDEHQSVLILLNGTDGLVEAFPMTTQWNTVTFTIDGKQIVPGVNRLMIAFPYAVQPPAEEAALSAEAVMQARFPPLGEIHSCTVHTAAGQKQSTKRSMHSNATLQ